MSGKQARSHERLIAIYDLEGKRLEATSCQNLPATVLAAYFDVNPYYVDTLNPIATKTFITEILKRYRDELSPADAAAMRGFFTDEPQISRNGIPWSFGHADAFRSAYGEDLLDVLPRLFREIGDFRQTRCRFWRLTTRMFMDAFLKQLYEWCEQNDWELTGHMVQEKTYYVQITSNGAVMPMYQYFHIPGMDALGRFFPSLTTPVQVASVAAITDNLLTLDFADYMIDGEAMPGPEYVLTIQEKLLQRRQDANVELVFTFQVDDDYDLARPLALLLERPEKYTAALNGRAIEMTPQGFFADPAFQRIDICSAVQHGQNRLALKTVFHQKQETYDLLEAARKFESEKNRLAFDSEIEAVYLCGAFGVRAPGAFTALPRRAVRCNGPFALAAQPVTVDATQLEQFGFPLFAGTITLQQEFSLAVGEHREPHRITFADVAAHVAVIRVNGKTVATLTRPGYEAIIPAETLRPGANLLEIDLVTSLRNMLGPHHLEEGESITIGPGSFYKDPSVYAPRPRPWNDGYCFVCLGITPAQ
ncbi:MAG: hypothetical protein BWX73_01108 [Lentisphaerae bacterium ADurb.Bin082]|nr:MAG: hypothetical protein BWX73_01108 [Lentisphaerae bacterium ADurb.Bin082]